MSKVWIGTSWKMNKTLSEALKWANGLADADLPYRIQSFVIPPFTATRQVKDVLANRPVLVGAQNMHWADAGAWTGLKTESAVRHGLIPLICIGETLEDREQGRAAEVLATQVRGALAKLSSEQKSREIWLAYEPVWAIGENGIPATSDYAEARQAEIIAVAREVLGRRVPCLYGGSVNPGNCAELITCPHIDGLFIGRSAWDVDGYLDILKRCDAALSAQEKLEETV